MIDAEFEVTPDSIVAEPMLVPCEKRLRTSPEDAVAPAARTPIRRKQAKERRRGPYRHFHPE
jgi:hypothetical protein